MPARPLSSGRTSSSAPAARGFGLRVVLVLGVLLFTAGTLRAEGLGALAARVKRSVVHLELRNTAGEVFGVGSGFLVSREGAVITNHHVIEEVAAVTAVLADGRRVAASGVLALDEAHDLALLSLPGTGYEPLAIGSAKGLAVGDEVVVIGSPAGLAGSLSVGIVSALRGEAAPEQAPSQDHPRAWAIQITAAISPGSSGSPVLAPSSGRVVGVAVGQRADGESLNFAVPADHVRVLIGQAREEPLPLPGDIGGSSRLVNLLWSGLFFASIAAAFALGPRLRRGVRRSIPRRLN